MRRDFREFFICDSLDDRVSIDIAHFCLPVSQHRGGSHVSLSDKLSLRASGFKTRSLGYYASDAFSRIPCVGVFFYTTFHSEKLKAASIEILPSGVRLADLLWRLSQLTAYAFSVSV